jgi:hypothetical protein
MFPAVGWVRADKTANVEVLSEINELRKHNAVLQKALAGFKAPQRIEGLARLDEKTKLRGEYTDRYHRSSSIEVTPTWGEVFALVSPYLAKHPNEHDVKKVIEAALFAGEKASAASGPYMDDQDFHTVGVQLKALGLIELTYVQPSNALSSSFFARPGIWSLTPAGEKLMMELRAVRSSKPVRAHKNPS